MSFVRSFSWLIAASITLASCAPPAPPVTPKSYGQPQAPMVEETPVGAALGTIPSDIPAVKVALLLPLSGESQAMGKAMLDAATMALYDTYFAADPSQIRARVVVMPKDTGLTPGDAAKAAQAVIDQGATFIVGPVFSQAVTAITPIARQHNIGMLTFSNNRQVAAPSIYTFGFLPEQQVMRMAEYAYLQNYTNVALLTSNDAYGQKIYETLGPVYEEKGGVVAPTEQYAPNPSNIEAAVTRLAAYNAPGQEKPFRAIFIADGGPQLRTIIDSIKNNNINLREIKLFGTGLWDDPGISEIPEMIGARFSSSQPSDYRGFEQRFVTTYGYKPARLASLSYDAMVIVSRLLMQDANGLTDTALTNDQGFDGLANGLVRLRPNGISDRKLAILEVIPGGFKVVDAAPKYYEKNSEPVFPSPSPQESDEASSRDE